MKALKMCFSMILCLFLIFGANISFPSSSEAKTATSAGIADQVRNDTSTIATSATPLSTTSPGGTLLDIATLAAVTADNTDIVLTSDTILWSSSGATQVNMGTKRIAVQSDSEEPINITFRGTINLRCEGLPKQNPGSYPDIYPGVLNIGANTNLYLEEGSETTLTDIPANFGEAYGIKVVSGNNLDIYGDGTLNVIITGTAWIAAGIGCNYPGSSDTANIEIHSGNFNVDISVAAQFVAGIGYAYCADMPLNLIIDDGNFDIDVSANSTYNTDGSVVGIGVGGNVSELTANIIINNGNFDIDVVSNFDEVAGVGIAYDTRNGTTSVQVIAGTFDINVTGNKRVAGIGKGLSISKNSSKVCIGCNSAYQSNAEKLQIKVAVNSGKYGAGIGFGVIGDATNMEYYNGTSIYHELYLYKGDIQLSVNSTTNEYYENIGYEQIYNGASGVIKVNNNLKNNCTYKAGDSIEGIYASDEIKTDTQLPSETASGATSVFNNKAIVIIQSHVTNIELSGSTSHDLNSQGTTSQLSATVTPTNAFYKDVKWTSSASAIATVDSSGLVTFTGTEGNVTITATAKDGSGIYKAKTIAATRIVLVTSISVTADGDNSDTYIMKGTGPHTLQLNANVLPATATNKNVSWGSNNTTVATIDSGFVTFTGEEGTVTFTGTAMDGSGVYGTKTLTVLNQVLITSISLTADSNYLYTLAEGDRTLQLGVTILPSNATNKQPYYTSNKESVATVNSTGLVTFTGVEGTVTFTAIAQDGTAKLGTKTITVTREVAEVSVAFIALVASDTFTYTTSGLHTLQLNAVVLPSNATNKQLVYESNCPAVATVNSSGLVTFTGEEASVTIVAEAKDGSGAFRTKMITVEREDTVEDKPVDTTVKVSSISLTGSSSYLYKVKGGNTLQLKATVSPTNATNTQVGYASSNTAIATVNSAGLVSFRGKEGSVTITGAAKDGSGVKGTKTITVCKNVTAIKVPLAKLYVTKGKKVNLNAVLEDSTDKTKSVTGKVTYTSSNKSSLSVDTKGNIKAKKKEKKTVTVAIKAANGKTLKVKVYIVKGTKKIKSLKVTAPTKLKKGNVYNLTVKPNASTATNLVTTFKSNKKSILSVSKSGKLVALKKGKAKITVTVSGKKVTKTITVA